jgi:tetratricopeptide (TPR) repeat protein
MLKKLCVSVLLLTITTLAFTDSGNNLSIHVLPGIDIPLTRSEQDFVYRRLGISARASFLKVSDKNPRYYFEGITAYHTTLLKDEWLILNLLTLGAGGGLHFTPTETVSLRFGMESGWYLGFFGDIPGSNPYGGLSFNSHFTLPRGTVLKAGVSYNYFLMATNEGELTDLFQGLSLYFGASLNRRAAPVRYSEPDINPKLTISNVSLDPVFPVFHTYYNQNPIGRLSLINEEQGSINDVRVSLLVPQYMDGPKECACLDELESGGEAVVDLFALFNEKIMGTTEGTMVTTSINIDYSFQGKQYSVGATEALRVHNRNALTWDDDRKAAAFVSARDPSVMQFSKNIAGIVRNRDNNPINLNFRIGMGIFDALGLYGVNYVIDPQTPYKELSQSQTTLDYIQFPLQSLTYVAGDCDDLSILYAACLESVGIETAFITVPGHIFTAFNLGISRSDARKVFSNNGDFIYINDSAWVPIEVTLLQEGYLKAWQRGSREWNQYNARDEARFISIHDAWQQYEPVGISAKVENLDFPSRDESYQKYSGSLESFISKEIAGSEIKIQNKIQNSNRDVRFVNELGVLYARYGRYSDAEELFHEAISRAEFVSAMINVGNIKYLQLNLGEALSWYEKAVRIEPDNALALAGLACTNYKIENYEIVNELYERIAALDEAVAGRYAYLVTMGENGSRASASDFRDRILWADAPEGPDEE